MVTTAKRREDAPQAPGNVERLRKLYELSMTLSGDPAEVFARIAPMIGELLEVPIVCLSQIVGDELHFLSVYDRGNVVSNAGRYPLSVTPCATVERTRDIWVYDRVAERFPDAAFLKENNAVSYCGCPSLDNDGKVVAVTFLLDDRPHDFTPDDRDLLGVFGQRIGMEIERQKHLDERDRVVPALDEIEANYRRIFKRAEAVSQASQARFAGILEIAQEAVISVDGAQRIQIFNKGAERLFGDATGEIIGQPLDLLMPARLRAAHGKHIDGFARAPEASRLMNRRGEIVGLRKDGAEFPAEASVSKLELGGQIVFTVMLRDITGRKKTENALRDSEERFRDFAEGASDWFWEMDAGLRFTYHSERYFEITGFLPEDKIGTTRTRYVNSADLEVDAEKWTAHSADIEAHKPFKNFEHSFIAGDGRVRHVTISGTPVFDPDGNFLGYRGTGSDITDRRMAENALRDSEARVRDFAETASDWFWEMDENLRFTYFSNRYGSAGLEANEPIGKTRLEATADDVDHEANRQKWRDHLADLEARRPFRNFEHRGRAHDGRLVHISVSGKPVFDEAGVFKGYRGTATDITPRKKTESALRDSEAQYRNLIGGSIQGVLIHRDQKPLFANQAYADIFGYDDPEEIVALPSIQAFEAVFERDRLHAYSAACLRRRTAPTRYEFEGVHKGGTHIWLENFVTYVDWGGKPAVQSTTIDITARKRAEQALKESEERLSQAAKLARLGHWIWDEKQNRVERSSPELARIFGLGDDAPIVSFADFLAYVHSDDRHLVETVIQQVRRDRSGFEVEIRIKGRDGETRYVVERSEAVLDETGELVRSVSTVQDITEIKQAEEQLRHAQKMEAVGQLTGGVAHDFNNLLAVILGHAELLEDRLGADDPSVRAVSRTATRGAELTQRLLAFSRRQSLEPEVMDLDALIAGMTELLRRTLGETIEIELTSETEPWQTLADPGQVENALLNLAINARDAMPEGGRLTIATDNVTLDDSGAASHADAGPGDYVRLTVTDTGTGMASEVLERAFEPFFTTKDVGEGSGLGLPMVYGFAKQSGGFVSIGSEEDRGTTVELYLPRAKTPDRYAGDRREEAEPKGRGESILVIEDHPDLRQLATSMLDSLGYRVLEAESAKAALEILDGADGIDLMLADVVLSGGMSGPCLADEVRHQHPDIKVLFMSGYAGKDIAERCSPCEADGVLEKPFRKRHLAHKVRAVLDGSSSKSR